MVMSERDLHCIEILSEVVSGRRSVASAASLLAVSSRHVHRLLGRLWGRLWCSAGLLVAWPTVQQQDPGRHPGYAVALVREKMAVPAFSVPREPAT